MLERNVEKCIQTPFVRIASIRRNLPLFATCKRSGPKNFINSSFAALPILGSCMLGEQQRGSFAFLLSVLPESPNRTGL
jgi:hypothetical protein